MSFYLTDASTVRSRFPSVTVTLEESKGEPKGPAAPRSKLVSAQNAPRTFLFGVPDVNDIENLPCIVDVRGVRRFDDGTRVGWQKTIAVDVYATVARYPQLAELFEWQKEQYAALKAGTDVHYPRDATQSQWQAKPFIRKVQDGAAYVLTFKVPAENMMRVFDAAAPSDAPQRVVVTYLEAGMRLVGFPFRASSAWMMKMGDDKPPIYGITLTCAAGNGVLLPGSPDTSMAVAGGLGVPEGLDEELLGPSPEEERKAKRARGVEADLGGFGAAAGASA